MMDFSGSNRGYLFVRYSKPSEAKLAIRELNNYEIRPGKFIGVIPSVDNRKLWISGKYKGTFTIKVAFFQKELMHFSYPQTDEHNTQYPTDSYFVYVLKMEYG